MSGSAEQVGGCTTLVMGFFPQGESGKPVQPTTNAAVKSYFGTPETEAERYAYYACKTVFDNGGNLVAARIPYNNNSQYLTPAVKYNIEEWSTKHIKKYQASNSATKIVNNQTAVYRDEKLDDTTTPAKSEFYFGEGKGIGIYTQEIHSSKKYGEEEVFASVNAISSNNYVGNVNEYYELTYNPFTVTKDYTKETETGTLNWTISATVTEFELNTDELSGTAVSWNELIENSDVETNTIARVSSEVTFNEDEGKYLCGTFDAGTYYKYIWPIDEEHEFTDNTASLATLTDWAATLDYFPIVGVSSSEAKLPYDTFEQYSDLPARAIKVTTEGGSYYKIINSRGEEDEVTNDTVFKVIEAYGSNDAYGNYDVTIGEDQTDPSTGETYAELTYIFNNTTDGYYVYDPNATTTSDIVPVAKWRRFWDYVGDPHGQWIDTTYNTYNSFRVVVQDSMGQYETGNDYLVNETSQSWSSGDLLITASRETGELTFTGSERGEFKITPMFHDTTLTPGMDCSFFVEANAKYFNIEKKSFDRWNSNVSTEYGTYFYTETVCAENKNDFYFDPTVSSPVTAFVESYGTKGIERVMAVKSYYESGEGMQYPEFSTTDYLELRLWNADRIKTVEDLKADNAEFFDVVHREYTGELVSDVSKINSKYFKAAPLSTDVTNGYYPEDSEITSDTLAIPATDSFDANNYPELMDANPFGTGWMKVLKSIRPNRSNAYSETDFFQFVSPYTRIEDVALAHSEKYQWIHWTTPMGDESDVSAEPGILLSRTLGCEIKDVPVQLSEIENVVAIVPDQDFNGFIPLEEYQDYRDEAKTPKTNSIVIANITEQKFGSDMYNNAVTTNTDSASSDYSDEVLGIVPVLMGGFQALPRQSRIELPDGITNSRLFDAVQSLVRGSSIENDPAPEADHVDIKAVTLNPDGYVRRLGTVATAEYDAYESTYSNQLLSAVPAIDLNANYKPNGAKMNYLTLAVCQLSLSKVNDNKIAITVLETFTGSLDKTAKDDNGNSLFIDNVVNNEDTGSTYVKLFSNYQTSLTGSQSITDEVREIVSPASNDTKVTLAVPASLGSKLWWTKDKPSMSLGFTNEQTKKYISYATIVATMENVFDALSNVDEIDIDLVMDAGLSTIANRVKKYCDKHPEETKMIYDVFYDKISSVEDVAGWKSMCSKLTTFCQTTRKDCITLLDAPRSLCVKDNVKLVSPGGKYSVDYDILPKFNYLGGMNSSYAAGYCDWLLAVDDFTSKNVWLPPSIAAEGAVIYTDYNSNYWMPPAGQARGNVMWAVDVAFNPNAQQQDSIYSKGWNYAISSSGSIMVWGQKTMLNSTSSFNRINIRRLFCRLERMTRKNSKWVIFEINNERTRNIYKDRIDPIFANVKAMGGIFDYQIICDARNNTPTVVQNNEFRSAFLIKPEHAAEYIILTFFNMNQDMDFSEAYSDL